MERKLRHYRKQKRWTTQYTAEQLNISRRMLVAIESGERTPSIKIANKLEDLFKIPQRELLDEHFTSSSIGVERKENGSQAFSKANK